MRADFHPTQCCFFLAVLSHYSRVVDAKWVQNRFGENDTLPYPLEYLPGKAGKQAMKMVNVCRATGANRYEWADDKTGEIKPLLLGKELCSLLPCQVVELSGDSLANQIAASFQARTALFRKTHNVTGKVCGQMRRVVPFIATQVRSDRSNGLAVVGLDNGRMKSAFIESDPRFANCSGQINSDPLSFYLHVTTPQQYAKTLSRNTNIIIYNQFAHLGYFVKAVMQCYSDHLKISDKSPEAVQYIAHRDVMRFWSYQAADWAAMFRDDLPKHFHVAPLVFYRTAFPAADPWARTTSNREVVTPMRPMAPFELSAPKWGAQLVSSWEFGHDLFATANDMHTAAFRAAGHGVLDLEWMQGTRIDAHFGSGPMVGSPGNRNEDLLHFCMPGVPDRVADELVRTVAPLWPCR